MGQKTKLGDLPVVSHFIKGFFRLKPPTPRLSSTLDVKRLLEQVLEPLVGLTLRMLSFKLAAFLALTYARAHELIKLDLNSISIKSYSWEFSLAENTKVSRPGHPARKTLSAWLPSKPYRSIDPGRRPGGNLPAS